MQKQWEKEKKCNFPGVEGRTEKFYLNVLNYKNLQSIRKLQAQETNETNERMATQKRTRNEPEVKKNTHTLRVLK